MKRYILTGGPGSGKSSILLDLEICHGEHVVREAAEDYIKSRQAKGKKDPWTEPDFQDRILDLQLQRESRVPNNAKRVFIDRGVADGLAYAMPLSETFKRIEFKSKRIRYDQVFLIEPLEQTEKNEVRRENRDESLILGRKLEQIYSGFGYEPISIASGPLEERVQKILLYIGEK